MPKFFIEYNFNFDPECSVGNDKLSKIMVLLE